MKTYLLFLLLVLSVEAAHSEAENVLLKRGRPNFTRRNKGKLIFAVKDVIPSRDYYVLKSPTKECNETLYSFDGESLIQKILESNARWSDFSHVIYFNPKRDNPKGPFSERVGYFMKCKTPKSKLVNLTDHLKLKKVKDLKLTKVGNSLRFSFVGYCFGDIEKAKVHHRKDMFAPNVLDFCTYTDLKKTDPYKYENYFNIGAGDGFNLLLRATSKIDVEVKVNLKIKTVDKYERDPPPGYTPRGPELETYSRDFTVSLKNGESRFLPLQSYIKENHSDIDSIEGDLSFVLGSKVVKKIKISLPVWETY